MSTLGIEGKCWQDKHTSFERDIGELQMEKGIKIVRRKT